MNQSILLLNGDLSSWMRNSSSEICDMSHGIKMSYAHTDNLSHGIDISLKRIGIYFQFVSYTDEFFITLYKHLYYNAKT
jgi:hypothetical protein